eukprot:scaffold107970_cov13-Prasinocladus_malaysianus.AAC.1
MCGLHVRPYVTALCPQSSLFRPGKDEAWLGPDKLEFDRICKGRTINDMHSSPFHFANKRLKSLKGGEGESVLINVGGRAVWPCGLAGFLRQ